MRVVIKKRRRMMKKNKGFTLIELMIVLVIIGILAMFIVPKIVPRQEQKRSIEIQSNCEPCKPCKESEGIY
jgi:general secretion pathway protein G